MEIRFIREPEILPALHLVWEVFAEKIAPTYEPEGVAEFQRFIKYENINNLMKRNEIYIWGAFDGPQLKGVGAIDRNGHVNLLFVRTQDQRRGIARLLMNQMYEFSKQVLRIKKMTVNAAPGAVGIYIRLGFQVSGPEQTVNGIRFVPMQLQKNDYKIPVIIGASVLGLVIIVVTIFVWASAFRHIVENVDRYDRGYYDDYDRHDSGDDYYDDYDDYYNDAPDDTDDDGIADIDAYTASNLSFHITEETYQKTEAKGKFQIDFNVKYPQISGLAGEQTTAVNQKLMDCAMKTVNELYINPSQEMKEKLIQQDTNYLVSYVEYKVTYLDDQFVSVVYQDQNLGVMNEQNYTDLRTININLKDGTVYEVKDLVTVDYDFANDWSNRMEDEASDSMLLSGLSEEQKLEVLNGNAIDGKYEDNFFVDADGVEIGLNFHGNNTEFSYAWVTASYSYREIKPYLKDAAAWESILNKNMD